MTVTGRIPIDQDFTSPAFVERLRCQDSGAITALVRAYSKQLVRAGFGMGFDNSAAAELAQNTWITFFEKVPDFQGRSHIRTFLFGILYHKASELRRDKIRHRSEELDEDKIGRAHV